MTATRPYLYTARPDHALGKIVVELKEQGGQGEIQAFLTEDDAAMFINALTSAVRGLRNRPDAV